MDEDHTEEGSDGEPTAPEPTGSEPTEPLAHSVEPASTAGSSAASAGQQLGANYRMLELIGSGAMGAVYRGRTSTGEDVAIKSLRPELARDPVMVTRFLQERSILTGLRHPNIVRVRDLVAEGETLAIVMDLVHGHDLRKELTARQTLPPAEAAWVTAAVLRGLAAVHGAGVIHRDIKPENVLLDQADEQSPRVPKLSDFGVAKLADSSATLHQTTLIGTPLYMAPELVEESEPTVASDLYSVGILLYELLCGITPFAGGSALTTLRKHAEDVPGRPPGVPDSLWETISALLAKDPAVRPKSAAIVAAGLESSLVELATLPALTPLTVPPPPDADGGTAKVALIPTVTDTAPPPAVRISRRTAIIAALVALVVLGGAGAAGAVLLNRQSSTAPPVVAATTPATAASAPTTTAGTSTTSRTTTSDSTTTTTSSPSTTTLATNVMPDLTNKTLSAAISAIASSGLAYQVKEVPSTTAPDGTVVDQSPKAGAPIAPPVVINVARTPAVVYLADLVAVGTRPDTEPFSVNGVTYAHGLLTGYLYAPNEVTFEYDLGRRYTHLSTTVGVTDRSTSDTVILVEVILDGRTLWTKQMSLGEGLALNYDVTGGLRLALHVKTLTSRGSIGFGDAQITGLPQPSATSAK